MRLAFLGTPEAAVPSLRALVDAGHDVAVVLTRPDRRRGRGGELVASPVKQAALELGILVVYNINDLLDYDVEMGVVVAFGALIPAAVLERIPMLNVHFSLLPRWRGAAPVERAILAGDALTGVSIMTLERALDTGPVHLERQVVVGEKTSDQLTRELAQLGAEALVEVLANSELLANPRAQTGEPTYAEKLTKETFRLSPAMSPIDVVRTVRLGKAYCMVGNRRIRVLSATDVGAPSVDAGVVTVLEGRVVMGCRGGGVVIDKVQPEGATAMTADAWVSGARWSGGSSEWT